MHSKTWVFLRGLIRQHRHWEDFPRRFEAAFPGSQVLALDLPGNGDLCDRESPVTIGGMVESARRQLQQRNVHGPVNLLAISLGGMTAIEWMERYPQEIEHGVLINTSLRGMSGFTERLRPENYRDMFRNLWRRDLVERERFILDLTTNLYPQKEMLAQKWAGYALQHPTSRANALRQLAAAASYKAPKARPHEHVLMLQSLGDHLVNPVCSTRIADAWRWPLLSHPSASHDLTLDDGDWVITQISLWLAGEIVCPR